MFQDEGVRVDPHRQQQARRYAALKRAFFLAELVLAGLYLGALVLTNETIHLRALVAGLVGERVVVVAVYVLSIWIGFSILSFPFGIVSGWWLPRRYGISVQSFLQWLGDWAKGEAISIVLGGAMVEIVYALLLALPAAWWIVAGVLYILFIIGMANLAPILLLPLFFKLTPLDRPSLTDCLERLANQACVHIQDVFRMNLSSKTTAANAALMGLGNTRRVVLGDTLLDHYSPDEIAVVFAHELGHHAHGDVPRLIGSQAVVTFVGLYLGKLALEWGQHQFGYQGVADVAGLALLALTLGIVSVVTMPILNALSRHMERAADWYALCLTQAPQAFITTMTRLADQNLAEYDPARWVEILFYDHPSIAERIQMARQFMNERRVA